jgi:hypothetical protein
MVSASKPDSPRLTRYITFSLSSQKTQLGFFLANFRLDLFVKRPRIRGMMRTAVAVWTDGCDGLRSIRPSIRKLLEMVDFQE